MLRANRMLAYLTLKRVYQYYIDRERVKASVEEIMKIAELRPFFNSDDHRRRYFLVFTKRRKVDIREIDKHEQILQIIYERISAKSSKRKDR
jgi:hypothetical protein